MSRLAPWSLCFVSLLATCSSILSQAPARTTVGVINAPDATFSGRSTVTEPFHTLKDKEEVYSGELLVSLPGGSITSKNGAVTIRAHSDFEGTSPLPILETAFTLNEPKDTDLDFTLDRGRVDLTNKKTSGPARVNVTFWDQKWSIILEEPQSVVSLEICGRWQSGARFRPLQAGDDPEKAPAPIASLVLLVLKGAATVNMGGVTFGLKSPPGPAELRWNSLTGGRPQPLKLERIPEWADPNTPASERAKKVSAAIEKFRLARAADPAKAIEDFLASKDPVEQRVAIVTLGAVDDYVKMANALVAAKSLDEWDFGITVLRHWLGRCRGQDQRLYSILTTVRGFSPEQAKVVLQLLFGFSDKDMRLPETYEVLIDYLTHEKIGIRNLAAWHLIRLVPEGKTIGFKPDGTPEENEKAIEAWKKLIPAGKVPAHLEKK